MQQLTLIRHGVTEWNVSGKFQGHTDIVLSEQGRLQAQGFGKHLKKAKVDSIYSSPLQRALETAQIVFPNQEILQDSRLKRVEFWSF